MGVFCALHVPPVVRPAAQAVITMEAPVPIAPPVPRLLRPPAAMPPVTVTPPVPVAPPVPRPFRPPAVMPPVPVAPPVPLPPVPPVVPPVPMSARQPPQTTVPAVGPVPHIHVLVPGFPIALHACVQSGCPVVHVAPALHATPASEAPGLLPHPSIATTIATPKITDRLPANQINRICTVRVCPQRIPSNDRRKGRDPRGQGGNVRPAAQRQGSEPQFPGRARCLANRNRRNTSDGGVSVVAN